MNLIISRSVFAASTFLIRTAKACTTGPTPATIADMIEEGGKTEGASKSAQQRTQSSRIII